MNTLKTKILLLVALSASTFSFAAEPSSEIPAKREFPLSSKYKACDDFHKYVCDEVETSFKLRPDRSYHTFAFNDSAERILESKKSFFANIEKEKNLSPRGLQLKNFYKACMNEEAGKTQEIVFLKKRLDDLRAIKTVEQLMSYLVVQIEKGHNLIGFGANSSQDNPKINDIFINLVLMNLPEYSYYDNKELMADYKKLIVDFFKIVDPSLTEKDLNQKADLLIAFEKEFVAIYPHPEVERQRWVEKRQQTQAEFLKKYPQLALEHLFKKIPSKTIVFNPVPESFEFLNSKAKPEHLQILKDFYLYKVASGRLDDSQPEYFNKQFAFKNKYLGGSLTRSARDERCTRQVMSSFPRELDQILVPRLFPNFPEEKFLNVSKLIRQSIITGLKKNTWLEPETKAKAILKIEKAKLYLVKPQNEKEWNFWPIKKYSQKNKIENNELYSQSVYEKLLTEIKNEANLAAWWMGPLTVNAYYDASANKFVMPMGILQYPMFNAEGDLIENLGAVGTIMGHELGHGVDDQGSKYDETGRMSQWMTMKDLKEFSARGHQLITQFNKAGHNGSLTLGENIGDLVGLTFSYNAAFPDGKGSIEDKKKLFVAYARVWCNVALPKMQEQQLKTNPHALGWARINEQVKHQKAFAEAFQCQSGDKMTLPESERVQIW